jgi:hypothetical protein
MTATELLAAYAAGQRDFFQADLRKADLRKAPLCGANLEGATLEGANLEWANLEGANLGRATLEGANLGRANLRWANLEGANLGRANLEGANLFGADLEEADLEEADLRGTNLRGANLRWADLSGAQGLPRAADFLRQFPATQTSVLVLTQKPGPLNAPPPQWNIAEGAVLTEVVNPDRCIHFGCGVSFAAPGWFYTADNLWLAEIAWLDLADVVVPFGTDGKARCGRLTLVRRVTADELARAKARDWGWAQ